jgi:hypothetical protein
MGTFKLNPGNSNIHLMGIVKRMPSACIKMLTGLLKTMAWAVIVVTIMLLFTLMLVVKFI